MPSRSPSRAPHQSTPDTASAIEVELKLAVRSADLPLLRARLARFGEAARGRVDSTYLDTPDRRLCAARAALRLRRLQSGTRRRWVQTFKTGDSADALSRRGEWEVAAPAGRIDPERFADTPLLGLLGGRTGLEQLRPVFRTVFERSVWQWRDGAAAVEIALDVGEIRAGAAVEAICELELELRAGPPDVLFRLALALTRAPRPGEPALALLPYGDSKAARGFRLAGGAAPAPDTVPAPRLDPGLATPLAVNRLLEHGLRDLLRARADFLETRAAAPVHRARVALRRLRALLRLFGAEAGAAAALAPALRRWAHRFGEVRNADVLAQDVLPALQRHAPALVALPAWSRIEKRLARERLAVREKLACQLEAPEFARFALKALRVAARDRLPRRARSLGAGAHDALAANARVLLRAVAAFPRAGARGRHRARLLAKTQRYGLELLPVVAPARYRRVLARFQEASGRAGDAELACEVLTRMSRSDKLRRELDSWRRCCIAQSRRSSEKWMMKSLFLWKTKS